MARLQAERVHEGVVYDLVVNTSTCGTADCAQAIASHPSQHHPRCPLQHQGRTRRSGPSSSRTPLTSLSGPADSALGTT